jgi:DNA-binding response OmpR family regulator
MSRKILLIDDDELLCKSLKAALERKGYDVSMAENGRIGLSMLESETPDVIVLDLFMPEMEGIETLRRLRKSHPSIPVYAVTGGGAKELYNLLDLADALGAAGTLRKPFGPADLIALIEQPQESRAPKASNKAATRRR